MLIAIFADIHANRQAFSACLAQAREHGAERIVLLGDYVGYGADPEWTVTPSWTSSSEAPWPSSATTTMRSGAPASNSNAEAQVAIEWTRGQLERRSGGFSRTCRSRWRTTIASTCIPKRAIPRAGLCDHGRGWLPAASTRHPRTSPSAATSTGRRSIACRRRRR